MTTRRRLTDYNHEVVFSNDEELQKYVIEKGWLKFKELKRVQKGGFAIYYYCKAIKWMNAKCKHMMLVVKEDNGLIIGKTTDGGLPHAHAGMCTPKRGPKNTDRRRKPIMVDSAVQTGFSVDNLLTKQLTALNRSADVSTWSSINNSTQRQFYSKLGSFGETSQLLSTMDSKDYTQILEEATPRLLQKMREAHEERKADEEREVAAIFANASPDLVEKLIIIYRDQNMARQQDMEETDEVDVESLDTTASAAMDLFTNASPELIERLKEMHELKKRQEEEAALKLFSAMPSHRQRELLHIYCDDTVTTIKEESDIGYL